MSHEGEKSLPSWRATMRSTFERCPADYRQARGEATEIIHAFHDELARALTPRLNGVIATMPKAALADRRALASWCNSELRELGLAIKCPRTGRPAILVADSRDGEQGRFRLQVRDERGTVHRTWTSSAPTLPELELVRDVHRREAFASRHDLKTR